MTGQKDVIILVNPPNKKLVLRDMYSSTITKGIYNWPCVDLLVLSGILKNFYDVKLIDANTLRLSLEETVRMISLCDPKGICFAFGNSVQSDDYNFVRALRESLPNAKIVGTGGLLYHNAEQELINHPEFDACLLNFTTDDIVRYFEDTLQDIKNLVYRTNGKIVKAPLQYPENGFSYPIPLHEQLPLNRYNLSHGKAKPLTSVITSFGCPGSCKFCVSETIQYRYRDPCNVIEELKAIRQIGVKEIFFRDVAFCANKKQAIELLNVMIECNFGFSWVADTRANTLDTKIVSLMKKSGCHALHLGVESANPNILKTYGKNITLEQIRNAFKILKDYGIKTVGYFILGLPGETVEDVLRTIDLALELDCDYASFNVPIPIIGTSLRREALQRGWIKANEAKIYDGSLNPVMETEFLSSQKILQFKKLAYKKFYLRPWYAMKSILRLRNFYQTKMLFSELFSFLKQKI